MSRGSLQPPGSHRSAFALEAHGHPFTFDNYGDFSLAIGQRQHFVQCAGVVDHTDVFNRSVFAGVGLTGRRRMGSRIFAEDRHLCSHGFLPGLDSGMAVGDGLQVLPESNGNQHIPKGRYCQCLRIDIAYAG
jgi:hypothetical protein